MKGKTSEQVWKRFGTNKDHLMRETHYHVLTGHYVTACRLIISKNKTGDPCGDRCKVCERKERGEK